MGIRRAYGVALGIAAVAAAAVAIILITGSSGGSGSSPKARRALAATCFKRVFSFSAQAVPVAGSTAPAVMAEFSVLRRARSRADALPAASDLRNALWLAFARTYDPSRSILLKHTGPESAVYAVPASVSVPALPSCAGLAGGPAYLRLAREQVGHGPGICLVSTEAQEDEPPSAGASPPKAPSVVSADCMSHAVLTGYYGALGDPIVGAPLSVVVVPDGVGRITYGLAGGRRVTVAVAGNIATVPAALRHRANLAHPTDAEVEQLLSADLPMTVTDDGTGAHPTATFRRPPSAIADDIAELRFLTSLFSNATVVSTSSKAGVGNPHASRQAPRA